ncbi:MAG: HD domain-containing protein [Bacteroidetes bacterium]|nr:HD domain-containing protein [Bacteroidota bacterium]
MTNQAFFKREYDAIFRFHRTGGSGIDVTSELTEVHDTLLKETWAHLPEEFQSSCAVVALGGYGRYELSPHSDLDIMLLFENETAKVRYTESAQKYFHLLWNFGFEIGHSVRTIDDRLNLFQTDIDVWASVLESRYVCGSMTLVQRYAEKILNSITQQPNTPFITAVLNGVEERHKKYEHSVKLLEPNIKNSAGGLRDLHSLVWVYRAADIRCFGNQPFCSRQSATLETLQYLLREKLLLQEEVHELIEAFNFLLRVRNEIHYTTKSRQDILEFDRQFTITQNLGYHDTEPVRSVERCMREYYLHARAVYRVNRRLLKVIWKNIVPSQPASDNEEILDEIYLLRENELCLKNPSFEFTSPEQILKAFYWCGARNSGLNPPLASRFDMLSRNEQLFRTTKEIDSNLSSILLDILRLPSNVARTLQMMNDCGILGKFIPEWGELVAFFQHSVYHYYTTDAHTLIALEHAEQLSESKNLLGEAFQRISNKTILYLAVLFHDIAKPGGITEHEIRGVAVWKKIQERFGFTDELHDVAFLIRNHLAMEQIAFRRNIGDPVTIESFAHMFYRLEQRDMLLVITYADLSAVNKTAWTNWKEMLLQELYARTRAYLLQKDTPEEETAVPFSPEELLEIEQHLPLKKTVAVFFHHEKNFSAVTILTRDAQYLLSTLCGVLAANDVNIFDAKIFTREDGIVIDSFRVVNAATKETLTAVQEEAIRRDIERVLEKKETLETLFERYRLRWKRRVKPLLHPNIRIDVVFHQTEKYTIIDVYGPDMIGFLYKITRTLSKENLHIYFARLATRGDGIVDSFYVRNKTGMRIESKEEQQHLRRRLLDTIELLMNVEMTIK